MRWGQQPGEDPIRPVKDDTSPLTAIDSGLLFAHPTREVWLGMKVARHLASCLFDVIILQNELYPTNRLRSSTGFEPRDHLRPKLEHQVCGAKGSFEAMVRTRASAFPSPWPTEDGYGDPERIERPAAMVSGT